MDQILTRGDLISVLQRYYVNVSSPAASKKLNWKAEFLTKNLMNNFSHVKMYHDYCSFHDVESWICSWCRGKNLNQNRTKLDSQKLLQILILWHCLRSIKTVEKIWIHHKNSRTHITCLESILMNIFVEIGEIHLEIAYKWMTVKKKSFRSYKF